MKLKFSLIVFTSCLLLNFGKAQSITSLSTAGISSGRTVSGTAMTNSTINCSWLTNAAGGNYDSVVLTLTGFGANDSIIVWCSYNFYQARNRKTTSTWKNLPVTPSTTPATYVSKMTTLGFLPGSGATRAVIDLKAINSTLQNTDIVYFAVKTSGSSTATGNAIMLDAYTRPYRNAYRWSGAKGADWQTSTNWTPNRTTTKDSDIIVIQQLTDAEINIPYSGGQFKQTIGGLMMNSSCTAVLSNYTNGHGSAAKSIISFLKPGPSFPNCIALLPNSRLTIGGTDSIEFHFPITSYEGIGGRNGGYFGTTNSLGNGARVIFSGGASCSLCENFSCDANTSARFGIESDLFLPSANSCNIGGPGEIIIDKGTYLDYSPQSSGHTITLMGKMLIYGVLDFSGIYGTIISNSPSGSSAANWNSWEPYLQFKNNGTKKGILHITMVSNPISGGVLWEMYNSGNRAWRTVGFPMKNDVHLSQITDNIVITGTNTGNNLDSFNSFGSNCTLCKPSAWYWDEATGSWADYQSGSTANKVAQGSGLMLFFRGIGSNGVGNPTASATPGNIDFKGELFTGSVTKNLSYTSSAGSLKGYNLISNPYPCNISFSSLNAQNIANKYLIYEPVAKMYNSYDYSGSSLALTGSTLFQSSSFSEAETIEMGSSFFVIATGSSASITFEEFNKVLTSPKISAFKSSTDIPCNQLKTKIAYADTNNKLMDRFLLEWDMENKGASQDIDFMDLNKLYAGYLGIGSVSPSGQWLGIDRRPDLVDSAFFIPLKTKTLDTNYYTLNFQTCPNNANYAITLIDKEKNTSTNIENESEYAFSTKGKQTVNSENRFAIKLEKRNTGYSKIATNKRLNVYPSPLTDNHLNCTISGNSLIKDLNILTIDGRILFSKTNVNSTFANIEIPESISNGIYLIQISTNTNEKISNKFEILRN